MIQTLTAVLIFALSAVPVSELDSDPATWNGSEVTVTGEIVGDYSLRDDIVWFQLNDDPYATMPLGESGLLEGGNVGIGVRIARADWSSDWGEPGRYGQRGPIVEVTGTFLHNSAADQGETFARPIENAQAPVGRAIVGGILAVAGLALYWQGRRPRYRRT